MPDYKVFFIGPNGDFVGRRDFEAADDAAALHAARCIYGQIQTPHHGFELWRERRCLYASTKERLARKTAAH